MLLLQASLFNFTEIYFVVAKAKQFSFRTTQLSVKQEFKIPPSLSQPGDPYGSEN
jgi:hypothetical protein